MFKGYHQTSEKSIADDLMNLKKYPGNHFLDSIDPNRLHQIIQEALHGGCLDISIGIMSMFLGVSTRKYDQVIEHAAERLSIKKSAISDAFKAMTKKNSGNSENEDWSMRICLLFFFD